MFDALTLMLPNRADNEAEEISSTVPFCTLEPGKYFAKKVPEKNETTMTINSNATSFLDMALHSRSSRGF